MKAGVPAAFPNCSPLWKWKWQLCVLLKCVSVFVCGCLYMNYDIEDLFEYFFNWQDYQRNYYDSAIDVIHSSLLSLLSLFLFYDALSLSFLQLSLHLSLFLSVSPLSLFCNSLSLSVSLFLSIFIVLLCVSQVDFLCSHNNTKTQKHEKRQNFLKTNSSKYPLGFFKSHEAHIENRFHTC